MSDYGPPSPWPGEQSPVHGQPPYGGVQQPGPPYGPGPYGQPNPFGPAEHIGMPPYQQGGFPPYQQGGFPPPAGPPPRRDNTVLYAFLAGGTVVVLALVAVLFYSFGKERKPDPAQSNPPIASGGGTGGTGASSLPAQAGERVKPSEYSDWQSNSVFDKINQRGDDPDPLTVEEVFSRRARNPSYDRFSFTLTGTRADNDCTVAAWGTPLQQDLRRYGCTQIIRGAYLSTDRAYAGNLMVLNVTDVQAATAIVAALKPESEDGWLLPVTPAGLERFGQGYSYASGRARGHYVVVSWVARTDTSSPSAMGGLIKPLVTIDNYDFLFERLH